MKKLITSAVAALALLFGFASCSGDLHDAEMPKHEPVTIDGAAWYYYDITVYGDNDGESGKFILNGSAGQSVDTIMPKFAVKDGGAVYFTADVAKKNADNKYELLTSYQTDNPAYTATPGTIRFYIYTNEISCNFYCFDNDDAFKTMDGKWPGVSMTKIGAEDPFIYIDGCKVINITSEAKAGQVIYFMEAWIPGNTWNTAGTCIAPVIGDSAVYKFSEPVKSLSAALKVQPRVLNTTTNLWDGAGNIINNIKDFTSSADGITLDSSAHYYWVLDCNSYTASLVAVTE